LDEVGYEQFAALDLRVGVVESAKRVEGTEKLLELCVDIGSEKRTLVAGIADSYDAGSLPGMRVVVLANLKPRAIRGITSQGMLLAADVDGKARVLSVEGSAPAGAAVR
jgi:methionine--tRNA ligase beta chain